MTDFWRRWLIAWCLAVMAFGLVLAGAGFEATSGPTRIAYGLLGPGHTLIFDPTLRFSIALMGAVTLGWGMTMLGVVVAGRDLPTDATVRLWRAISVGVVSWFVIDSSLSIATGFPLNAVSNTILLVAYLIPMRGIGTLNQNS
ncbi:MAG: hypothetical protein ABIQ43_02605 [Sphingomonas sp.]